MRLVGFITEPTTVRQILEHVGEPTIAPPIAPARSPPLQMKIGQELAAPEAVFEAIPELEFDQMVWASGEVVQEHVWISAAKLQPGMIGWGTTRESMQSRPRNWSSTRHWGGNPARKKWHMRRRADWCGSGAGVAR